MSLEPKLFFVNMYSLSPVIFGFNVKLCFGQEAIKQTIIMMLII